MALYLGWQGLLAHKPLSGLLAASARGPTPTIADLQAEFRAEFRSQIWTETDDALAARLRDRYPFLTGT